MSFREILLIIILVCIVFLCLPRLFNKNKDIDGYEYNDNEFIQPYIMHNVLTKDQCDAIINASQDKLEQSSILSGSDTKIRNSSQAWLERTDPLVSGLFERLAKQFNIPVENAESLQVINYKP